MKKLLSVLTLFVFFTVDATAATYNLYYKTTQYGSWTKAGSYSSESSCEQVAKSSYSWAYATKCNIGN